MTMNLERLTAQLKQHEGYRSEPYKDSVGILTIGYGRNLENGIRKDEAEIMLHNDIKTAYKAAQGIVSNFDVLSDLRKEVLVNMVFNMGKGALLKFRKMRAAIERNDFERAADEMLNSRWAEQVGYRADELEQQMRHG